jgi:DNA-binding transcriptional ArsR family regulator
MSSPETPLDRALRAIADPARRRILAVLKEHGSSTEKGSGEKNMGLCAGDIEERVGLTQPTISHHMAILTQVGLVEAAKRGQWRWYRRNQSAIRQLVKTLRARL